MKYIQLIALYYHQLRTLQSCIATNQQFSAKDREKALQAISDFFNPKLNKSLPK